MTIVTVTTRGRLTIPRDVRDKLGLRARDRVLFMIVGDRVLLTPVARVSAADLAGCLRSDTTYHDTDAIRAQMERAVAAEVLGERGEQ